MAQDQDRSKNGSDDPTLPKKNGSVDPTLPSATGKGVRGENFIDNLSNRRRNELIKRGELDPETRDDEEPTLPDGGGGQGNGDVEPTLP
ncbi:MAG: hypothetical protein R3B57_12965 [Phycisphaerales bacterium]